MALRVYRFSEIVTNIATAVQGSAATLVDFTVGSILRAVAEATAGVVLWLQAIILQLLTITRAATSSGADLDSWMADFSFPRLPAAPAAGLVTFARFTTGQPALIPAGASVRTADGSQAFTVQIDTSNPAWAQNGYTLAANASGIDLPVEAVLPGTSGNAQVGTVTVLATPVPGVDTVTNAAAFTTGIDAESDAAFRARFALYVAGLSKATKAAIGSAVANLRQGLQYTLTENENYDGSVNYGHFVVVVDDGTGYPDSDLLASVANAVETVRALTTRYAVFAPVVTTADVALVVTSAPGYNHPAVIAAVAAALASTINSLPLGGDLPYTQLAAIAYSVPGVTNVTSITLNGGTADLVVDDKRVIKLGATTIS